MFIKDVDVLFDLDFVSCSSKILLYLIGDEMFVDIVV